MTMTIYFGASFVLCLCLCPELLVTFKCMLIQTLSRFEFLVSIFVALAAEQANTGESSTLEKLK